MLKAYYIIPAGGQYQVRCGDYTGADVLLKTCKRVETAEKFAEGYFITKSGNVYSGCYGPKPVHENNSGYPRVAIAYSGKHRYMLLHRLLLLTFKGPCPKGMLGCHKDDNPKNYTIKNLYWGTRKQNISDMISNLKRRTPKMTKEEVIKLRKKLGLSQTEFASRIGLASYTYLSAIENGRRPVSRFVILACKDLKRTAKNSKNK